MARAAAASLSAAFWFRLQDDAATGLGSDNAYGLKDRSGAAKPAYYALRNSNGWLTAYPNGHVVPPTPTLNFGDSAYAIANGSITSVGDGGQVCVSVGSLDASSSGVQVIVDATGYLPNGVQSQLTILPFPLRVADTRAGNGAIANGTSQCFQITGLAGIPFGQRRLC